MTDAATIAGQRARIGSTLRILRGALDSVESFLSAPEMDVEAAQNVAYGAVRLVSEAARLYQMQRDAKGVPHV